MSILRVASEMLQLVTSAVRTDAAALNAALAMVRTCLGDEWKALVRLEQHMNWRGLPEARITLDGRVIHRQWWEQVGEYTWALRQEWCP